MSISRSQIPEEIDAFQFGGDPSNPQATDPNAMQSIDTQASQLEEQLKLLDTYRSKYVPDYGAKYQEYFSMLKPFVGERRRASIYDLATELSRGLAAQAASGQAPSIGTGLAYGFNSFSDAEKARRNADEEALRAMQLKAAGMAIEDVKSGEKLYNQLITDTLIKDPTKLGNVEYFVKVGEDGKTIESMQTAYEKDKASIDALLAQGYRRQSKAPETIFTGPGAKDKIEEKIMTDVIDANNQRLEKSKLALANDQNLDKFAYLQSFIPEGGLGKGAVLTGNLKEYLIDLPVVGDLIDEKGIGARQAIKNVQINFTLDIVGPYKGAISNKELDIFQASVASLANERMANDFIIITSKRANQIARDYATAMDKEQLRLNTMWNNGEISAAQVQSGMQEFESKYANSENAKIFNQETMDQLAAAGFTKDDIVDVPAGATQTTKDKIAKKRYIENLMKGGYSEEEAMLEADKVFGGISEFRNYRKEYIDEYNKELAEQDEGFVDLG
jgi:hypothetical protein